MNKLIAFVLALALALTLVGCNKEKSNENNETHIFQGEIIEFDNGAMLVEPLEGYSEAEYAQRIRVVIQNMPGSPEPRVGDVIEVTYSGIMTEESPPSPTGVEKIVVIKRTPDDEIIDPQEDEHLISVTSEGSMIHPFLHFAYSEHWAEDGFLCADGTPAGGELKEWSEESSLPEIEWSEDFTVTYADELISNTSWSLTRQGSSRITSSRFRICPNWTAADTTSVSLSARKDNTSSRQSRLNALGGSACSNWLLSSPRGLLLLRRKNCGLDFPNIMT